MEGKATETKYNIRRLVAKLDPRDPQKVPLIECGNLYDSILRDALIGGSDLLRPPTNPKDAEFRGNDATYKANLCELKFHGGADVIRAIDALKGSPNPKVAQSFANDAKNKANICELKFKNGDSPLSDENNDMNDVAKLAAAIVRVS
ncbi:hypothetical protein TSUD_198640 [Trifolium subterraneum]|uniref:Pectinesterase inhibitor domain-containing protein n=1 Tax=Trifolium subterraneum TaxID=3900 RepID=A0A2Z6LMD3_TRISU|nr:hypothetical protein TSUD_198640 [Trifolium subterraneum]